MTTGLVRSVVRYLTRSSRSDSLSRAASKAGIFKLTEALAEELKEKDITVNAILPSTIDTAPNRAEMPKADFSRWVKPEQIGAVIAFLLSDDARAITGALIPIAGRV